MRRISEFVSAIGFVLLVFAPAYSQLLLLGSGASGSGGSGAVLPTWTGTADPASGATGNSVTFSAVNLGATDPTRLTVLLVNAESVVPTGVSVGGINATKGAEESSGISGLQIWFVDSHTLGTSANVVMSAGGNMVNPQIMVGQLTHVTATPTGNATIASNTSALNLTVSVPSNGFAVAGIYTANNDSSENWAANATTDFVLNNSNPATLSMGHTSRGTGANLTARWPNASNFATHGVIAAWGP